MPWAFPNLWVWELEIACFFFRAGDSASAIRLAAFTARLFQDLHAKADIAGVRERTRCTRFVDEVISRVQCLWVVSPAHRLTLEASRAQR